MRTESAKRLLQPAQLLHEPCLRQTKAWDQTGVCLDLVDLGGTSLSTGSAMGRMFLTMMAGCAELERNSTSGTLGMSDVTGSNVVSIGSFQLDLTAGELWDESHRIRLKEQPFASRFSAGLPLCGLAKESFTYRPCAHSRSAH
jgi:hypothetical protein